jgi:hypothetical protein
MFHGIDEQRSRGVIVSLISRSKVYRTCSCRVVDISFASRVKIISRSKVYRPRNRRVVDISFVPRAKIMEVSQDVVVCTHVVKVTNVMKVSVAKRRARRTLSRRACRTSSRRA